MSTTEEELQKKLQEEKQKRSEICMIEVNKILEKYKCRLSPKITIEHNQIQTQIGIIALEEQ